MLDEFKLIKSVFSSQIKKNGRVHRYQSYYRDIPITVIQHIKTIAKKTIPVNSKAPSADPILHRNPLSSLPPEATRDASVGLHATVKTSSAPRKGFKKKEQKEY